MAEQNKGWGLWETILKTVQSNKIWKSIFRREYPRTTPAACG